MNNVKLKDGEHCIRVQVPMTFKRRSGRKEIIMPDGVGDAGDSSTNYHEALVIAISRAHRWKKLLDEGKYVSVVEMSNALGINRYYLARLLRLTLLAPDIVETILDGCEPDGLSIEQLRRPMPLLWEEQGKTVQLK